MADDLDRIIAGSLAQHARRLGAPGALTGDLDGVLAHVDRRRSRRRGVATAGSLAAVAAGVAGILTLPGGGTPAPGAASTIPAGPMLSVPVDEAWRCTGALGSDGADQYFESCEWLARPGDVTVTTTSTSTTTAPPGTWPADALYPVEEGDTVVSIAGALGIDADELAAYNGWPDGTDHALVAGDTVVLPPIPPVGSVAPVASTAPVLASTVPDTLPSEQTYTVRGGDSLFSIAQSYGISLEALANYNDFAEGIAHVLFAGDDIKIPPGAIRRDP